MKKLFGSLVIIAGLVNFSQAQFFDYVSVSVPSASLQTNLVDGPCVLYEVVFDPTGCASVTTNLNWEFRDSPRTNTPRSGTATANILEYTNTGYSYWGLSCSNINYNNSNPTWGVNAFTNYAGVVTYITNSAVLSNYCFTVSNNVAGSVALRPIKLLGAAVTNTTTTYSFPTGVRFGMGISMTNKAGVAAVQNGYIIKLKVQPVR